MLHRGQQVEHAEPSIRQHRQKHHESDIEGGLMREAKFTQGEWRVDYGSKGYPWTIHKAAKSYENYNPDDLIATTHKRGDKDDMERIYNAHLIAAAPEMYKMLEAMCYSSFQNCEIEALLKKARGEQ